MAVQHGVYRQRVAQAARTVFERRRQRCARNLGSAFALIGGRVARGASRPPVVGWTTPFFLIVGVLTILSFTVLDQATGAYRGKWDSDVVYVAKILTDFALGVWYIAPAIMLLLAVNQIDWTRLPPRRLLLTYSWTMVAAYVLVSVGGALLLSNILKRIIGRARPQHFEQYGAFSFDPFAVDASWASFPSGHSATIGAVGGALLLFWPGARGIILPVTMVLAATRIVVGAHYPSDVVVGYAFGFVFAVFSGALFARLGYLFECRPGHLPIRKKSMRLLPDMTFKVGRGSYRSRFGRGSASSPASLRSR